MDLRRHETDRVRLPSGATLALGQPRSAGVLDPATLAECRRVGIPLAYDPLQLGWVPAEAEDDLDIDPRGAAPVPRRRPMADRLAALSRRYRLRPWAAADRDAFRALLDNPKIWEHLPEAYPAPLTDEMAEALIELSREAQHHEVRCVEHAGAPIGQVRLAFDAGAPGRAEISYWLGEAHWGQGHGAAIVELATALGFRTHEWLDTLYARVHAANPASARLLEKAGYAEMGRAEDDPEIRVFEIRRPA